MESYEKQPIDAEYHVYDDDGGFMCEPPIRRASRKVVNFRNAAMRSGIPQIFGEGVNITLKMASWCTKQFFGIMAEGVKGIGSGMIEAGSSRPAKRQAVESYRVRQRSRQQPTYVDNRSYTIIQQPKKKKRPFWYIPTKEEEMMDNLEG